MNKALYSTEVIRAPQASAALSVRKRLCSKLKCSHWHGNVPTKGNAGSVSSFDRM